LLGQATPPFELIEPAPLTLAPGEVKKLTVQIRRHSAQGPVALTLVDPPGALHMDAAILAPGSTSAEAVVYAVPDATPGPRSVHVRATTDGGEQQAELKLTIAEKPAYALPHGWHKADGADRKIVDGRVYYDPIEVRRGDVAVRFLLIPHQRESDPKTFYIMQDKVWGGLFRVFAADSGVKVVDADWQKFWYGPDAPVFIATAADAEACANWLGGKLPLAMQWDKAAGRYENNPSRWPFGGKSNEGIAVGRLSKPNQRGASPKDETVFGCRDMAGNGFEWTGEEYLGVDAAASERKPIAKMEDAAVLILRGQGFAAPTPMKYPENKQKVLVEGDLVRPPRPAPGERKWDAGFRVVLELD
jgi:hypothetical protein